MNVTLLGRGRRACSWPSMTCSGASQHMRALVLITPGGIAGFPVVPSWPFRDPRVLPDLLGVEITYPSAHDVARVGARTWRQDVCLSPLVHSRKDTQVYCALVKSSVVGLVQLVKESCCKYCGDLVSPLGASLILAAPVQLVFRC